MSQTIKIFYGLSLDDYFGRRIEAARMDIRSRDEDYILNVDEDSFAEYLIDRYGVGELLLRFDRQYVSSSEKGIPGRMFQRFVFDLDPNKLYQRQVITYHIPFEGKPDLLSCEPNPRILWTRDVMLEGDEICFEIINFNDNADEIKNRATQELSSIRTQYEHLRKQLSVLSNCFPSQVREVVRSRKQEVLKQRGLLAALGVPIHRKEAPSTFSIPAPQARKKIAVVAPVVQPGQFVPDPTLEESTYLEILRVIYDVGKQFERMPSTYQGKREEALRDHFLLQLEPRFLGTATGETFNKQGKTDILLRYEGKNAFVAECKFWKGEKGLLDAISQLLSYLTWRDSKAALIMFVKRRDISPVLESLKVFASQHPCFNRIERQIEEGWYYFTFHLPDDRNRKVRLSVLVFHFPPLSPLKQSEDS